MPGTVPKHTDPALIVTSAASSPSSTKAAIVSDPGLSASASPAEHPAAGIASTGAAQLTATNALTSALAPTNQPAQMMARPGASAGNKRGKGAQPSSSSSKDKDALKKFVETDGHFSLVRNFHLADAFTLMNGFCGAQSLFASARYLLTSDPKHAWAALWFPLFGAIFDLLDGKVARWRKSSSMLGQELDSLADSLSFGAAPAFAAFALGLRLPLDTLLLTMFVCAGIARLARFNVTTASIPHDATGKAQYFEGLPIPSSLVLVGGMAICLLAGRVEPGGIPFATPLYQEKGSSLAFTASLRDVIPGAKWSDGVPLGILGVDVSKFLANFLVQKMGLDLDWATRVAQVGSIRVHTLSLLWGAWAMAMVSKTLRVPKP